MGQRPNQQHHRTEAWTMVTSTTSRANPTGLSSLKRKTKKNKYIQHREHRRYRGARNQARSKPDTVDRPVRTARTIVHHYNGTHYCNTETVFINIPIPPDQHHISDVVKWR